MPNESKSRFELIVELVRALAWPCIAIVVLVAFWGPLRAIARQLPDVINRSETITIAGVSLKVREGLKRQATPEVANALSRISPEGLRLLVTRTSLSCWESDASYARSENAELLKLGLMEEVSGPEACQPTQGRKYTFSVRPSPLGKEAQSFLLALVAELAQQIATANDRG